MDHSPWNSPGQNTGVGSLSLLQGIFPTQGLNLGLPHCRRILYLLGYQGSPLESYTFPQTLKERFKILTATLQKHQTMTNVCK